jgi:hypothetical protein
MEYAFTVTLNTKRSSPVRIDPAALYGYWERIDGSEGGGLWFERLDDGRLELSDYDGTTALRQDIVDCLRENGYVVGPEFYLG